MRKNIPCYGVIAYTGNQWTVSFHAEESSDGCYTTSNLSGYGAFPFDRFPRIPVIDYTGDNKVFEALRIPNYSLPMEINPPAYNGTLDGYLKLLVNIGIKIINRP